MIKACFFDIDGTLYSHTTDRVPESTKTSLELLKQKGIKIVVCTGRSLSDYKILPVSEINFDGYLTLNGMLCYDSDFNLFSGTPIPETDTEILKMIFFAEKIPITMINEHGMALNYVNDTVVNTQASENSPIPPLKMYRGSNIYQVSAFVTEAQRKMLTELLDYSDITSWHDNGIDIVAKGSGKDVGMKHYMEKYGIKREETMAFGDGENDIRMLKFAGIGVAMGNAKDELKDVADHITADIDDDGIEKALKHYNLI